MNEQAETKKKPKLFSAWILGNYTSPALCGVGLLLLRLMVGAIFVFHGLQKTFPILGGKGFESAMGAAEMTGFQPTMLWAVLLVIGELGGGILLILGLLTRFAALMTTIVMAVALLTAHLGDPFVATHSQQMLLIGSIVLLLAGGGILSAGPYRCCTRPEA